MQETYNEIWREIAARVRLCVSADAFQRWFASIELVQADVTHRIQGTLPSVVCLRNGTLTEVARKLHDFQGMAYSKRCCM